MRNPHAVTWLELHILNLRGHPCHEAPPLRITGCEVRIRTAGGLRKERLTSRELEGDQLSLQVNGPSRRQRLRACAAKRHGS
jgi:hypothetical protein